MSDFLKEKFLRVCPYGDRHLEKLVKECKRELFLLIVITLPTLVFLNWIFNVTFGIYMIECLILALYLILTEVPEYRLFQSENKVYRELLIYFSRVKHRYAVCRHGANAVVDASEGMQYEIVRMAEEIYRILLECNRRERVREYILYHPLNRYLKIFLLQIFEISEKGDTFFAENIEHLRLELMEEIYRRRKRIHEFAGYVLVTVIPFFCMPILKQWGLEFAPEMEVFYKETGTLIETITFGTTIIIYKMILHAKETDFYVGEKKSRLWNTEVIYSNRWIANLIRNIECCDGLISRKIKKLILQSGEQVRFGNLCVNMIFSGLGAMVLLGVSFGNILFCALGGISLFFLPLFNLYFQREKKNQRAVHEVRQFQTILLMERKLQGTTVVDLLEDMELFSVCFKGCLRRCINAYSANPRGALLRLKEEGCFLHHSFGEIADAFLSVDEAGIELSFEEVENNRRLLDKMTSLESEIRMERKKDSTDVVARIPGVLAVGIYFILPVFGYSLRGVYEVLRLLEEMQL